MFCAACGASMPDGARFCPKCGAAAGAAGAAKAAPPASAAKPAPAAGGFDLAQPKTQAEVIFIAVGVILAIFGLIGIVNAGGIALVYVIGFLDLAIAAYCAQGYLFTQKRKFADARKTAGICAVTLVVLGIVAIAISGGAGGTSLVVALLLAAALGFAYIQLQKLERA